MRGWSSRGGNLGISRPPGVTREIRWPAARGGMSVPKNPIVPARHGGGVAWAVTIALGSAGVVLAAVNVSRTLAA